MTAARPCMSVPEPITSLCVMGLSKASTRTPKGAPLTSKNPRTPTQSYPSRCIKCSVETMKLAPFRRANSIGSDSMPDVDLCEQTCAMKCAFDTHLRRLPMRMNIGHASKHVLSKPVGIALLILIFSWPCAPNLEAQEKASANGRVPYNAFYVDLEGETFIHRGSSAGSPTQFCNGFITGA